MENTSTDLAVLDAARAAVDRYHLLPAQGRVVVGVSGGPDSVCLLHLLKRLCSPAGPFPQISLHVAHLDHGMRGEASRADAEFVADLAGQWGMPYTVERADVPAQARAEHRSLEEAARGARYQFLRRVASELGAACIAMAHHADDQVETIVMHWLRGSGLAGLAGMRPLESDIIRPLLGISRVDILSYCAQQQLPFREDASNQDRRFLRNRIRHDLLPTLEQYNANLRETLLRNAAVLAEEEQYLETQLDDHWSEVVCCEWPGHLEGDVSVYRDLPLALRRRLWLRASVQVSAGKVHLEMRHVEASDAFLFQAVGSGTLHLPGGLRLVRIYGRFLLDMISGAEQQAAALAEQEALPVPLPVPGEARLPGTPWLVRALVLDRQHTAPPGYERGDASRRWGYMDLEAAQAYLPFSLRTRRPGDRFRPLGLKTEKKLQDVLVNEKIPRTERDQLPLVCGADDTILWVAGYQIADQVKVTTETRRVLVLELGALPAQAS